MRKHPHAGGHSPESLIRFYERLPEMTFTMNRITLLMGCNPYVVQSLAIKLGFAFSPVHPEFTGQQLAAIIRELFDLDFDHDS